jgi:hypothetical protein
MCVARCIIHHDGIFTWNEPSPHQRVKNTNLYFQKDIPQELVCLYGSVPAGIKDGPSLTSILYVDSSTGRWILCSQYLGHHNCTHPNIL